MRLPSLAILSVISLTAGAGPPGYRPPRRFVTAGGQAYRRPPLRLSLGLNVAYYNGDIASSLADNTLRVGVGAGLVQPLSPHLTFALDAQYFHLQARDVFPARGLAFEADNGQLTALLRYNLLADKRMYVGLSQRPTLVLLFLEAGAGGLLFNPLARQKGQCLPPEAGNTYPSLAATLPLGGGLTLRAGSRFAFTLEGLYYLTSTDLLDDVSVRGNPKSADDFATATFKVEVALGKGHGRSPVNTD